MELVTLEIAITNMCAGIVVLLATANLNVQKRIARKTKNDQDRTIPDKKINDFGVLRLSLFFFYNHYLVKQPCFR